MDMAWQLAAVQAAAAGLTVFEERLGEKKLKTLPHLAPVSLNKLLYLLS